jgi:hypothetical protein
LIAVLSACLAFLAVVSTEAARAAESFWPATPTLEMFSPQPIATAPTLRIGAYVGALSEQALFTWQPFQCSSTSVCPWDIHLQNNYLIDGHAVYTLYRFEKIPLDLEIEGGVAQRFGLYHQTEFDLIPMWRWKAFPWNDYLYTNFRVGVIGASYVTGVSPWEAINARNGGKGSNYLNFLRYELDFAPTAHAPYEVFIGLHHRSGVYGLINGSHGGSNYWMTGIRFNVL